MVLSNAPSRVTNYSSRLNQSQGGGSKKAGFPYIIGRSVSIHTAFSERGMIRPFSVFLMPLSSNVRQSRPISSRPMNFSYH